MATSKDLRTHQDWLGLVQPVGLVVSPAALAEAQAFPNANIFGVQEALKGVVVGGHDGSVRAGFWPFATQVLGWEASDVFGAPGGPVLPDDLAVPLREFGETLRPDLALVDPEEPTRAQLLVWDLPAGTPLDADIEGDARAWKASPHMRFERLLRDTGVGVGLLANHDSVRLVVAPRGESSGHLHFRIKDMTEVAGRPLLAALHMLLEAGRLWHLPAALRLPAILRESRRFQNQVSTKLAGQVLVALFELLRGFAAADAAAHGELLASYKEDAPQEVYAGLLSTLLRLVFLLYAEDQGLMPASPLYANAYAVTGLHEKLREDAGRYPDTMDQRFGAWPRLLALFRLVYDGSPHPALRMPARAGQLFDPDAHPFLEGRARGVKRRSGDRIASPRVSDGAIHRVLENLLVLDGERLSYRALDVEQIGSVYEAMMGFTLEQIAGPAIALGAAHVFVDLQQLLEVKPGERAKRLLDIANIKVDGKVADAVRKATTVEDLASTMSRRISPLTPQILPPGSLVLQPTAERRQSGSHYTPRSLTRPIVETTLRPVFEALGESPTPEQVLDLKVCDPAMGSAAFLVEACRFLGDKLVTAWATHQAMPTLPPGEDPILHARRLVAQRCLYGVDRNPFAVDLARLSLWLVTFAKDHPFTFLDHALRCGDSLVGLTRMQIVQMGLERGQIQLTVATQALGDALAEAQGLRRAIHALGDSDDFTAKRALQQQAERSTERVRQAADAIVALEFARLPAKEKVVARGELAARVSAFLAGAEQVDLDVPGYLAAFHWELEFPEVFAPDRGGFDAVVGNPPYVGGTLIGGRLGVAYHDYLVRAFAPATGLADLIAFFLRRAFGLQRHGGSFGMIGTNTMAQGDTRGTGLEAIVRHGGVIYEARRRVPWPGEAAVVASTVHIVKGPSATAVLDGRPVGRVSSYLLASQAEGAPHSLPANAGRCYLGAKIWGAGFLFEPEPADGSSSLQDLERLLAADSRNREVIFPYLGGEEFNDGPTQEASRFVIDFARMSKEAAQQWPSLFALVEERVRPVRLTNKQRNYREEWWLHANRAEAAGPFMREHGRMLALCSVSKHVALAFVREGTVVANSMLLICLHRDADFAVMQSRVHEIWARFLGSSLKEDLRYTTACFETFPRPPITAALEAAGADYYRARAALMQSSNLGLTKTYNRFNDPDERAEEILELRRLHAAMDRAVLDAYGWSTLEPVAEFLLDYEEEVDEELGGRRKRKPWRYRWSDATRDEVLARLLALNAERAAAEVKARSTTVPTSAKKRVGKRTDAGSPGLFDAVTSTPGAM